MTRAYIPLQRGQSLIEVLIAVGVTAVTVLGLIALQLSIARSARAASYREQAALVADAIAEAARAPNPNDAALNQWKLRAASLLPKGDASISGADVSLARVTWAWQDSMPRNTSNPADMIDSPAPCGEADVPNGVQCVVVAFSR
ncbi:prepilin-type N-terminal cleavage/methylation domain-containing protein [Paraburkholderia sp. C35]|uniref:type IV pilus modification PilV family protein n=1 Tax=Paraburkholderia sp. C35 TaxID=2126993 RepID=UPI000D69F48C|nr:prepilin-type N-terminal cleavage/methylation domain-containing protein [Paraburkholderia sp. C35]